VFNAATTFRLVNVLNVNLGLCRCGIGGIGGVIRGLRRSEDRGENEKNYCARDQRDEQKTDTGPPCTLRLLKMSLPHFKFTNFDNNFS